jgi:Xaa-Pro dipeptidase
LAAAGHQAQFRKEARMDDTVRKISADDINPRYNWGRALPALGPMGVDFEERVDYRRLHRYRLSRVKQALEKSDLGALLVFDVNNIRYITSTKIGEWERDKLCRSCGISAPPRCTISCRYRG